MSSLRQLLKQSIAESHQRLENLELMQQYSSGAASMDQYLQVTEHLLRFWTAHRPSTQLLPSDYHQFHHLYLQALQRDVDSHPSATEPKRVNEIAFFYVLLGSGLGANIICKHNLERSLPKQNLEHLAQNSGRLWPPFITKHLAAVPSSQHEKVVRDAQSLFTTLHHQIETI